MAGWGFTFMILSSAKVLAEMLHTQNIPKFRIIDVPFPTGWFLHRKIEGFRGSEHQPIGFLAMHLHIFTAVRSEPCIS